MRSFRTGQLLVMCSTGVLAACQDGVTAPRSATRPMVSASVYACGGGGWQPQRAGVAPPRVGATTLGSTGIPQLGGVMVTANFSGLPWNIMQQMQFPMGSGADRAPCLNSPVAVYLVDTVYRGAVGPEPVPVPPGVDASWWNSMSPREQNAIMEAAERMRAMNPGKYSSIADVINRFFREKIGGTKRDARLSGTDYMGTPETAELFAGGVYGCLLYRRLVTDPQWFMSNEATLNFVMNLVTAFAEAEFTTAALRAMAFGRNGIVGAAMAHADPYGLDCARMVFDSIPGGRITIDDPYSAQGNPPGGGGGRIPPPSQEPPSLPPGWNDY